MSEFPERTWTFDRDYKVEGPWMNEPDKVQWVDEVTGLDCLMVRNRAGCWCGYVGVTRTHPWYGVGYNECPQGCADKASRGFCDHEPESTIYVHGSLTFSDRCHEGVGDEAVCHVPYPGRDGNVWWFGFDTAHAGDMMPGHLGLLPTLPSHHFHDEYRDLDYVRREVSLLASQLAEL